MKLPPPGTKVKIKASGQEYEGVLLDSESENISVKLGSGYNVGIKQDTIESVEELGRVESTLKSSSVEQNSKLPEIHILHTGGTIASKVDYTTGAVSSSINPDEILASVPELTKIANITAKPLFQMFSEDIEMAHWTLLAKEVAESVKKGVKGIIVGMGTDTLEYVASALSFALRNCPVPVIVVGSQRSSDRPSTDASMNLICASQYIVNSDFKGVAVCLHDKMDDKQCLIVPGHHVKKMHTSRRDTFRPINKRPLARVNVNGDIEKISEFSQSEGEFELKEKFNPNVALVKIHPGFKAGQLDWYFENCDGLVIEGYAFGQIPVNAVDEYTQHHNDILNKLTELNKKIPVMVVSQRPYGVVHINVYSTGRKIREAGTLYGKMQSHVALVKMSHVLANYDNPKDILVTDLTGETVDRTEEDTFLI